jgi:DNA polymerase III subunit epsilon
MREIVLDTETTGLEPAQGHRLVEIGAVEIVNQTATGAVFHRLIDPERDVPDEAARVHGHTTQMLRGKPRFAELVDEFLAFIGEDRLVIHNAEFDMRFINAELARASRPAIPMDRVLDTLALARRRHPGVHNSLDALADRYRVDRSKRIKHGALLDAEILVEVYAELSGGRQRALVFEDSFEGKRAQRRRNAKAAQRSAQLPSRLEDAERAAHALFIETLGAAAIWLKYAPEKPPA